MTLYTKLKVEDKIVKEYNWRYVARIDNKLYMLQKKWRWSKSWPTVARSNRWEMIKIEEEWVRKWYIIVRKQDENIRDYHKIITQNISDIL